MIIGGTCGSLTTVAVISPWQMMLDVGKVNVNRGGKQRIMRDGYWDGKVQCMNYAIWIPKGLQAILEESGINTQGMNAKQMREILGSHEDFIN